MANRSDQLRFAGLSHALSRLRELFDDPLFERRGNVIAPTNMARHLIGPVQSALGLLERSINQVYPAGQDKARRRLNIGLLLSTYGVSFLPQLMMRMDKTAPYEISISHYAFGKLESSLASGKIDVAIQFEFPHSSQVRSALLSREALGIMARKNHPLAEREMDLETYLGQYHVVVAPYERDANLVDMEFQRLGLERKIALRCQDYWTACKTVESTDLLLTATRSTLSRMRESFPDNHLMKLPADLHTPEAMNICLYWHESAEMDPDILWLREALLSVFEQNRQ